MAEFFVTRKNARGQSVEVPLCDIPMPGDVRATSKEAAAAEFAAAVPELLNRVDQYLAHLESTTPGPDSAKYSAHMKAIARFNRRRAVLAEGLFPFGRTSGVDQIWSD
jgi:hypothetical protein